MGVSQNQICKNISNKCLTSLKKTLNAEKKKDKPKLNAVWKMIIIGSKRRDSPRSILNMRRAGIRIKNVRRNWTKLDNTIDRGRASLGK